MRSLRVDVVGGGPGGLFLARLLALADPSTVVRVFERNRPDDAFGFGVVFSDRTMSSFEAADPQTHELIQRASVAWTDMELRLPDAVLRYGGYGFTAISRRTLLRILQEQAAAAGARLCFQHTFSAAEATAPEDGGARIVVLADGANSANRGQRAEQFGTTVEAAAARYIWFGTEAPFDAVTFPFVRTPHGVFGAHAYPYAEGLSTFIVEADERTWRDCGMAGSTLASAEPGLTDEFSRTMLADVFAEHLGGRPLIGNNSKWATFQVVRNARWSVGDTVLLGDAAHTAHFSVGSGTKLAMQDAIALADALGHTDRPADAFARYESARRPSVARTQALAERSMHWWASFGRRLSLPPHRFGLHFVTRTAAIGYAGLIRRHPDRIADAEAEFAGTAIAGAAFALTRDARPASEVADASSALTLPVDVGSVRLPTRIAVRLPAERRRLALAATGPAVASLVLLDLRGCAASDLGWRDAATAVAEGGATTAIIVDATAPVIAVDRTRDAVGAALVEVVQRDGMPRLSTVEGLVEDGTAVCVGLSCPREDAWSVVGDATVDRCGELARVGVAAVHLHDRPDCGWEHLLAWADRIRTETGLSVLVDGPDGWAVRVRRREAVDDWATRMHVAVVSGRVDVVVAWPLPVARLDRTAGRTNGSHGRSRTRDSGALV